DDWALADKTGQGRHREIMGNDQGGADTFALGNELEMPVAPRGAVNGQFIPNQQQALMAPGGNTAMPVGQANQLGAPVGGGIETVLRQVQDMLTRLGGGQQKLAAPAPMAPFAPA